MKRSRTVRLTLMAATAAGLSACGDDIPAPGGFPTVAECVQAGNKTTDCETAEKAAKLDHEKNAPRFPTREECLSQVDVQNCTPVQVRNPDGSLANFFVPALTGFLISQALQRPQQQYVSSGGGGGYGGFSYYSSRDYPQQYRDSGNLRGSRYVQSSPGTSSTVQSARVISTPPNIGTTTISRSGFGSSSSFRSSSSGSS